MTSSSGTILRSNLDWIMKVPSKGQSSSWRPKLKHSKQKVEELITPQDFRTTILGLVSKSLDLANAPEAVICVKSTDHSTTWQLIKPEQDTWTYVISDLARSHLRQREVERRVSFTTNLRMEMVPPEEAEKCKSSYTLVFTRINQERGAQRPQMDSAGRGDDGTYVFDEQEEGAQRPQMNYAGSGDDGTYVYP